jgi:ABC-type cobalamin transport system ATPase subunit
MRGRTTVVIAHRLSTVQRAHQILVLEGGRVTAQGTHAGLLRRSPLYRHLYEIQFELQRSGQPSRTPGDGTQRGAASSLAGAAVPEGQG